MLRLTAAMLCGFGLAACAGGRQQQPDQPPNARSLVMIHRALLWRDLESIKDASIGTPQRHADIWRVCVRINIKGAFGAYTGPRDYLVALYGADKRPELVMEDAAVACAAEPHVPFPELEGGYVGLQQSGKPKPNRR